jgi:hypothetical protein
MLFTGLTAEEAYDKTIKRRLYLESNGYEVEEVWDCEVDIMLKEDMEMCVFFQRVNLPEPMDPREAFYGGRTNTIKLYHKVKNGEKIGYVDVCR